MGSARDSAPDPNRASGSARQPWPTRVRPRPMSGIAPATPPRPIYWNRAMHPDGAGAPRPQGPQDDIYTHVLNRGGLGVRSPVDAL